MKGFPWLVVKNLLKAIYIFGIAAQSVWLSSLRQRGEENTGQNRAQDMERPEEQRKKGNQGGEARWEKGIMEVQALASTEALLKGDILWGTQNAAVKEVTQDKQVLMYYHGGDKY